ncbi:MAG: carboxypeptidase M32 [Rhizobiaceae bacterium]|nr:carboxypeptidase M32 [Rhizobiaceae bacterium]
MNSEQAYQNLLTHLKLTNALSQASGVLSWDQETMMPRDGAAARAEQSAALALVIHSRNIDPVIDELCGEIDESALDDTGKANVREARRTHQRAIRIPAELAGELARAGALAQGIWAKARREEKVADFLPTLKNMVSLKQQEAQCLKEEDGSLYDALLDEYEPGMKSEPLAKLLGRLRPHLTALREKLITDNVEIKPLKGNFEEGAQMEMARRLASVFNYNWNAGRLDLSVHPFSSGYRSDSRITTRVDRGNPFDCMYSTVHEVGHANYEQGREPEMDRTPAGGYASMGIHESQSRMLENQIGRSRVFMEWLHPQMKEVFGDFGIDSPDELFAIVNKVETGFIRTEADEIHYNLHVVLRFELELALFAGDLSVDDLEGAWNERFERDFGMAVDKPSNGLLQDVHWSFGAFGYFPTYSLGNIYAGELFKIMGDQIGGMEAMIAKGELGEISSWLGENIHRHGNVYSAPQLMEMVCGKVPDEKALAGYLQDKFG